ncbi:MAG: CHAT domain-containing protein, partial [Ilumatobacteraceae bacterium]
VRVGALEFIERYADRANLAALALRSLATSVRLGAGYESLPSVIVERRDGGLPIGAALTDSGRRWRRFLITTASEAASPASSPLTPSVSALHVAPGDAAPADARRGLTFEVSLLGREARADRVQHHVDAVMIDALVDRLAAETGDSETAATLYQQLIPQPLQGEFSTASAVQFIVDPVTANFPWELLTAPSGAGREALVDSGAVMRQFAESEDRRLSPVRSTSQRALLIAAGNVSGEAQLPEVYDENDSIGALLRGALGDVNVDQLDDRAAELDLVGLQNALFGDHQIVHIASHGVYHPDEPGRTGAILSSAGMLTVNLVSQLPHVPDVVFLNCCSLGRIGMNRMAAGLAREFMAIGVRALVAAAWAVNDAAARAFAETFYAELTGGRPLGDTVARARSACAQTGGGETWAAYQCYGDPGFVLRGSRPSLRSAAAAPVSGSDLSARLDSLAVRTADLGIPGRGRANPRRGRLLAEWNELATWIGDHPRFRNESIDRRLAVISRDLGEFRAAADRLVPIVVHRGSDAIGLHSRTASAFDLQQAANCLARAAQASARAAIASSDRAALDRALADLDEAASIARAAVAVLPERESHGVLGSTLKRWATVDDARRPQLVAAALDAYRAGDRITGDDRYGSENALQLAFVVGADEALAARESEATRRERGDEEASSTTPSPVVPPALVDGRRRASVDYWSRADVGDRALTRLLAALDAPSQESAADALIVGYQQAFGSASTWSQRQSAIDHLRDLRDLLPADDTRQGQLVRAIDALADWEDIHVEGGATDANQPVADYDPGTRAAPVGGRASLTAFSAGHGDCLLVEYPDIDGTLRRLLVDGGLDTAYDNGLGRMIASQPSHPLALDTVIVTHVDVDHIGGAIRAFADNSIDAPDVWFNGLTEIDDADRGPRHGDELSALIPHERRNRPVGGSAMFVPADGPLPVYELAGGARCTLLSPTLERLERLGAKWRSGSRGPTGDGLAELFERLADDEGSRGDVEFGDDSSIANGSSIAVHFEHDPTAMLLTGDAFAGELASAIRRLLTERSQQRLRVDVFKLSHHGSKANVTEELLELVEPAHVLICTDGCRFGHPDVETLDLVRKHYPDVPIHFTDDTPAIRDRAARVGTAPPSSSPVRLDL